MNFRDLDVYRRLYEAMLKVITKVVPKLPDNERFDLADQMKRASKAPIAIIAEGYAKKNYRKDWVKYINSAIGECNEMMVHLSCCKDLYGRSLDIELVESLIKEYDIAGKQLYRLADSWRNK